MRRSQLLKVLVLALVGFSACAPTKGQSYIYATGNPSFGVNIPVENGFINVTNGNLHLEFSLASHKQRGALTLDEKLVYDSRFWRIVHNGGYNWFPTNVPNSSAGWRFLSGNETGDISFTSVTHQSSCGSGWDYATTTYGYTWTDPSGTPHVFSGVWRYTDSDCTQTSPSAQSLTSWANDSSGYSIYLSGDNQDLPDNITILDNNGNQVYPSVIDRYGNYWSNDSNGNLIDDLGRTPVTVTQNGNVAYYDVLTIGGNRARYTVTYAPIQINTAFNEQAVAEWNGTLNAVQNIQLPDGSQYSFTYDSGTGSGHYGEMTSMTLPTNGVVQFGWSNYFDSYQNVNRWLTSRTENGVQATFFTPSVITQCSQGGTGCQEQVRLTRPSGDEVLYQLTLNNGAWNTNASYYTGSVASGALLLSDANTYDFSNPCDSSCTGSSFITKTSTVRTYGATGWHTQSQYAFSNPQLGKPTSVKQWDFYGDSPSSIPARETDYGYSNSGFDLTSETVLDNQGTTAAVTNYTYGSSAIGTSGIVQHGSANGGGPFLQSISRWLNTSSSYLMTSFTSYDTGSVHTVVDARGNASGNPSQHTTTYDYDGTQSFVQTTTRPTTENGIPHVSTASYDFSSELVLRTDDENSHVQGSIYPTLYTYYTSGSNIGRLETVSPPQAGTTQYSYPSSLEVDTSTAQSGTASVVAQTITDSYGRDFQHIAGDVATETYYDSDGRVQCRTNPHYISQSSSTDGLTCFTYDGLDRPIGQTNPDSSSTSIQYSAFSSYVTDEVGHQKQFNSDVFGNLKTVYEPNGSGQPLWPTYYTYNAFDEMISAVQEGDTSNSSQWRTRTWTFDSLGRSIDEKTPEEGWTCFGIKSGQNCQENYDANGNLLEQTDANGNIVNFTYDALSRSLTIQTGGINYSFLYDVNTLPDQTSISNPVGRLVAEFSSGNATGVYSYHPMGWLVQKSGWSPAHPTSTGNAIGFGYDLMGNVASITYPDGRQVSQLFDTDSRLTSVQYAKWNGTTMGATYWSNPSYYPAGQLASATFGNGIQLTAGFNNRESITNLSYSKSGSTLWSKTYSWDSNAMNLLRITDVPTSKYISYSYDNLNRLTSAVQMTGAATPSTGSVTISGAGLQKKVYDPDCRCFYWVVNTGSVQVTIGSFTGAGYFESNTTTSSNVASSMASGFTSNPSSPVTAQAVGSTVTFTSKTSGSNTNYPMSVGSTIDDPDDFSNPAFTGALSGGTMTGGSNGGADPNGINETYTLDAWGDLTQSGNFSFLPSTYTAKNQVGDSGYLYDSAGNMTSELIPGVGSRTYDYNALNRLTDNGAGTSYIYDVEGDRIRKSSGSTVTEYVWVNGQMLATYDPNANTWQDFIYAGGQFLAEVQGSQNALPNYRLNDHLGSLAVLTDNGGNPLGTSTYTPYGQLLSSSGSGDSYTFAGLQWDSEVNSYHAEVRQLMGVEGRWLMPDSFAGSYDFTNPQSLNRYSYVLGNPQFFTDSTGREGEGASLCAAGPIACVAGLAAGALIDKWLIGLFKGPTFHGSLKPRPGANPWDDKFGVPYPGLGSSIGQAMGLPTGGCEFGVCTAGPNSFMPGAVAAPITWCATHPTTCTIGKDIGAALERIPVVLASVMLLNMEGDCSHCSTMSKGGDQNVADTGVLEQAREMVAAGLARDICDALEKLYNSTPAGPQRNKIKATQKAKGCRGH